MAGEMHDLLKEVFDNLFNDGPEPVVGSPWRYWTGRDPLARTRFATLKGPPDEITITVREQNPRSSSRYAWLPQRGIKCAWIFIDGEYSDEENFMAQDQDGEIWIGRANEYKVP